MHFPHHVFIKILYVKITHLHIALFHIMCSSKSEHLSMPFTSHTPVQPIYKHMSTCPCLIHALVLSKAPPHPQKRAVSISDVKALFSLAITIISEIDREIQEATPSLKFGRQQSANLTPYYVHACFHYGPPSSYSPFLPLAPEPKNKNRS